MKTRNTVVILALLLAAGCKARNENSFLPIISVIPPKAATSGSGATATLGCSFDPGSSEFTELPYNPVENTGSIAAVVQNNIADTAGLNSNLRDNSTSFLPHQAVVDYEFVPASAGTPPGEQVIPAGGVVAGGGGKGTVGFAVFRGLNIAVPSGTLIRVTMHLEGKLLDGSLVHSAEREYLFRFCTQAGCGTGGPWAVTVNNVPLSCL